ncbi:MAG: hypothetical protein ACOC45_04080 [Alkalispirochaetaceae bacterium]
MEQGPDRPPDCLTCVHFYVTWNKRFPRGCRLFGLQSRELPSHVVFRNTQRHCPAYQRKREVRSGRRASS